MDIFFRFKNRIFIGFLAKNKNFHFITFILLLSIIMFGVLVTIRKFLLHSIKIQVG